MKISRILVAIVILLAISAVLMGFAAANASDETSIVSEEAEAFNLVEKPEIPVNPFTDEIYLGLSMHDVWEIQNALKNQGFDIIPDGKYEMATDGAVRMFQERNGLVADGIAGVRTQEFLGLDGKLFHYGLDYLFAPLAGTGTGTRVMLSKAFSKVIVYQWNKETGWKVGLEAEAMVGAPGKETPSGDFEIISACDTGFSKNGKLYEYMMTFFVPNGDWEKAYGFHTVALDYSGKPLQSVESEPNRHVTAGCVRLNVDAAKWMYENVPVGSDVRIY